MRKPNAVAATCPMGWRAPTDVEGETPMINSDPPSPFQTFADIISCKEVTLSHIALAGEMIRARAEFNSFLAAMKGRMPGKDWIEFVERFGEGESSCYAAWRRFQEVVAEAKELEQKFDAYDELEAAFKTSATAMRSVVDEALRYEETHAEAIANHRAIYGDPPLRGYDRRAE
jgi:hypothetical protein